MAFLRRLAVVTTWLLCWTACAEVDCREPSLPAHVWQNSDAQVSFIQVDTARRVANRQSTDTDRTLTRTDEVVHLAYAGDNNVFEGMIASMLSVSRTISNPERLHIHLIVDENDLAQASRLVKCFQHELALQQEETPKVELHMAFPLKPDVEEWLKTDRVGERPYLAKSTTLSRFYLRRYLPTLDRVLWMDTDTIALADVRPLFDIINMKHPMAAAPEFPPISIAARRQVGISNHPCFNQLDAKQAGAMEFNSGVVLFDLTRFNESVTRDLEHFLKNCRDDYDQLAFNMKFLGDYEILDSRWNFLLGWPHSPEARANAAVLHFTGSFNFAGDKPWMANTNFSAPDVAAYRANVPQEKCFL